MVPIYRLLSAPSHCSITAFQVKMNLTFMRLGSVHTTPQLRCGADISITFGPKSLQHHSISSENEFNFHATLQCSNIAISVQYDAVQQRNAIAA